MLRDPVSRYLSEWKHVQRGATWKTSLHVCDGRSPTPDELPTCYPGDDWSGVSLREFMDCTYNLANNRQVRMLADLSLVGCYNLTFMNESERNAILLQSAKSNLKNMAFFGLTEFQRKTQFLFERTFNLKFISPFTQFNVTRASNVEINEGARQRIEELNFLDVQLYAYAKDLFQQRYHRTKQLERQRDRQKRRGERRLQREHRGRRWPRQDGNPEGAVTEDYNSQVNVPSDACDNIPVGITPPIEEVNISGPDSLAKRQWIFREEAIQLDVERMFWSIPDSSTVYETENKALQIELELPFIHHAP
ncbi:hypothetical protein EI555_005674 [Monodon monoceros]|uniref:Heparan-sulfate 6-O-sulfotransferase n=1 Tax=Monodon monoceros TaxID=40151 RepID=A0A4U1FSP5_MONMO|nr:hypothetical protein EI555_005674 [Monodon monoceros]